MTIIRLRDHCRIVWNVDDRRGKFTGDWSVVDGFVRLFHGYSTASATTTDFDYD
jgi:hypothetical protein